MRIKSILIASILMAAVPMFAASSKMYSTYESTRQALIKTSLPEIQAEAKQIAAAARTEKREMIAAKADAVVRTADLKAARVAFAALSDEMIKFRADHTGERPIVVYCSMEKKLWLQPKGEVSNPYVSAGMRKCGEIRQQ